MTEWEMAAILRTGIPGRSIWWERLATKTDKIAYLTLVLKGDFTDERRYSRPNPLRLDWVCIQYATQLFINASGVPVDREAFEQYGTGYTFMPEGFPGYGIPLFYAINSLYYGAETPAYYHTFNAVFIGEGEPNNNPDDWVFIEPTNDSPQPFSIGKQTVVYTGIDDDEILPNGQILGRYFSAEELWILGLSQLDLMFRLCAKELWTLDSMFRFLGENLEVVAPILFSISAEDMHHYNERIIIDTKGNETKILFLPQSSVSKE